MRRLLTVILLALAIGAGAVLAWRLTSPRRTPPPDPPAVVEKVRQVARLEALQVTLYKKVSFAPEPEPADSVWGDLAGWLRHTLRKPQGKAIVFGVAHLSLDASKLGPGSVAVQGREAFVVLPPLAAHVELRPGETEIIGSNLDSAETTRLLELARQALQREVEADPALRGRAIAAAQQALTALLLQVGLDRVTFVERLPAIGSS